MGNYAWYNIDNYTAEGDDASNGDSAGGPMGGMQSSAEVATGDFLLTRESCTFSNLTVAAE